MEDENVNSDTRNAETGEQPEVVEEVIEELDANALSEKNKELEQANRQLFERAKKAEGFVKLDGKWVKAPREPEEKVVPQSKAGELDETQLDYLDLKGITEQEDMDVIQKVIAKTGQTVRQALKDDYVISKLNALKANREVKDATPSSTRRAGGQTNDVATALAKYEQTGKLPDDFALRSAVINATIEKANPNKPAWH